MKKKFPGLYEVLGMIAEPTGTDGCRSLSHQRWRSSWLHMASWISGFKNVCQRAQAFASQLLPLQRPWHLQSKYQMLSFKPPIFRTDILSSQYNRYEALSNCLICQCTPTPVPVGVSF